MAQAFLATGVAILPAEAGGPWYVSPVGSDQNNCLSPSTTCASPKGAFAKASSGDTIFVATGTYTGTGEDILLVDRNVTLSGGWDGAFGSQTGRSTLDGQGARRGINVTGSVTVFIDRFIVQNGSAFSPGGGGLVNQGANLVLTNCLFQTSRSAIGGGIRNTFGSTTLNDSEVSDNLEGSGIANFHGTVNLNRSLVVRNRGHGLENEFENGSLTVTLTTISNNDGFGIMNDSGIVEVIDSTLKENGAGVSNYTGHLVLTRTTVSGHRGSSYGGAIRNESGSGRRGRVTIDNSTLSGNAGEFYGGGVYNSGELIVSDSTIVDNETRSVAGSGGGIFNQANPGFTSVNLKNTVLAKNRSGSGPDCSGGPLAIPLTSGGHNLFGNTSGCPILLATGDLTDVDPQLGDLSDHGGPTFTHEPGPQSPAMDAGGPACPPPTTDQRGVVRPQGAACDIGAFELVVSTQVVEIDIKPGSLTNLINVRSRGVIPVAILSSLDLNAPGVVDRASLTFGRSGDEPSLASCPEEVQDVNADGIPDLLCLFWTRRSRLIPGDTQAILKGNLLDGRAIMGAHSIKVLTPGHFSASEPTP